MKNYRERASKKTLRNRKAKLMCKRCYRSFYENSDNKGRCPGCGKPGIKPDQTALSDFFDGDMTHC